MKHALALIAILTFIVAVPACDIGGTRGPTTEQLAEAQQIEEDFAPLRQEAEDLIRRGEGSTDDIAISAVTDLQATLRTAQQEVNALRTAPRDEWDAFKGAAQSAMNALRLQLEEARNVL